MKQKEEKTKESFLKKVRKAMGRVVLPPNKIEETKKRYSRKTKHKKMDDER